MKKDQLSDIEKIEYYLGKDHFKDRYFKAEFPPAYGEIIAAHMKPNEYKSADLAINIWHPEINFRFNNLGYRSDFDYSVEAFKGKKLIVCLGCTDTFGMHAPVEEIWPTHLANDLKSDASDYIVLNCGVIGAGPDTVARLLTCMAQVLGEEIKHVCLLVPAATRREFVSKEYTRIISGPDNGNPPYETYWDFIDWKSNNYSLFKNLHLMRNVCKANDIELHELDIERFDKKVPFDHAGPYFAFGTKSHRAIANYFVKKVLGRPSLFEQMK